MSAQTNPMLEFDDLTERREPVRIGKTWYLLIEATGDAVRQWRNARLKASKLEDGKLVSMEGLADIEPLLVSLCLYNLDQTTATPTQPPHDIVFKGQVAKEVVGAWPARVQTALYERIKKISDLLDEEKKTPAQQKEEEDALKKAQSATTAGSP